MKYPELMETLMYIRDNLKKGLDSSENVEVEYARRLAVIQVASETSISSLDRLIEELG